MAILGGGPGGGGPVGVGNSFTGAAQALEIYGDFAAAYTGLQASSTSQYTVFDFTTGNYLFVGVFQVNAGQQDDSPGTLDQTMANIKFNGATISRLTTGNDASDMPFSADQPIIIPSYTEVLTTLDMNQATADTYATASFTGRIYRK